MQSYLDDTPIPSDRIHDEWERYFHIAQTLTSENDSIVFDLNLTSLMGENFEEFWRYQGSLTTPPCSEGVIWTMFKQPIAFMDRQIKILRDNIYLEDYRSPQPLYNRIVYRNFLNESLTSIPDYNQCLLNSEKTKIPLPIMSIIHCSSYSVFLLLLIFYSVLILIIVAYYRARYSNWKKKFE
jgi:hypothetical protein